MFFATLCVLQCDQNIGRRNWPAAGAAGAGKAKTPFRRIETGAAEKETGG